MIVLPPILYVVSALITLDLLPAAQGAIPVPMECRKHGRVEFHLVRGDRMFALVNGSH